MADYFVSKLNVILESLEAKAAKQVDVLMSKKSNWVDKGKFADVDDNGHVVDQDFDRDGVAKYVESLAEFDPTKDHGKYLRYIVDQLRENTIILPEDGSRLERVLGFFHDNKDKQQWKSMNLPIDLYGKNSPIKNWRSLEKIVDELSEVEFTTKGQETRDIKEGYELVFEITLPNIYKTHYKMYRVMEPEAAVALGRGTKWCTTELAKNVPGQHGHNEDREAARSEFTYGEWHPRAGETRNFKLLKGPEDREGREKGYANYAEYYMRHGPLYIVFSSADNEQVGQGGQILQFESGEKGGYGQIMGINDENMTKCSLGLDYAFGKWAESDPNAPMNEINRMRRNVQDYRGRPPIIEKTPEQTAD